MTFRGRPTLAYNGGDWRSKSLPPMLKFSTTLNGFYFANRVLAAVFFSFVFSNLENKLKIFLKKFA
jgi:hypothetical protein